MSNRGPYSALVQVPYLLLSTLCMGLAIFYFLTLGNTPQGRIPDSLPPNEASHGALALQADSNSLSIQLHPSEHVGRPSPITHRLQWNITKGHSRPDGVLKEVILINDQFPGPTIEVRSGDEVLIDIINNLGEPTAVHWHGLKVANDMDGVVGVTQCGIGNGRTFTYDLQIRPDQAGTFWYHSHSEAQRADGLFGAFIVHPSTDQSAHLPELPAYEDDQVLMVGDWYHDPATKVLEDYMSLTYFKNEIPPDSMLLNGKGSFVCTNAAPAAQLDCEQTTERYMSLSAEKTRLRIINVGVFTGIQIFSPGSVFRVITADGGGRVKHGTMARGIGVIHPGERVDVVLENDRSDQTRMINVQLDTSDIRRPNLALSPCQSFPLQAPGDEDIASNSSAVACVATEDSEYLDYKALEALELTEIPSEVPLNDTVLIYGTLSYRSKFANRPRGELNDSSWISLGPEEVPLLGLPQNEWPASSAAFIPEVKLGWTDVVLNNMDDKGHPFHLHGHDFYVLARREPSRFGAFELLNPFEADLTTQNHSASLVRKDTVHVPSRGHVVLRFEADTPGLWMFHCHVLWHQSVGMAMALSVPDGDNGTTWKELSHSAQLTCDSGG